MEKVTVTRKLDGSEAVVKMTVIDDKGQSRERDITMATKLYDGGKTEKRIYRFLSPADVQGTSVLVFDYEAKADDVWIYLPALRKTRRVVSSQQVAELHGQRVLVRRPQHPGARRLQLHAGEGRAVRGRDLLRHRRRARRARRSPRAEGYSKKTYWVSKDKFAVVRGLFYDKDGKLLKELVAGNIKLLDAKNKRYRPMHMEMINKQNGRRSVFESSKVTFAPNTKDEYFTTAYLERS